MALRTSVVPPSQPVRGFHCVVWTNARITALRIVVPYAEVHESENFWSYAQIQHCNKINALRWSAQGLFALALCAVQPLYSAAVVQFGQCIVLVFSLNSRIHFAKASCELSPCNSYWIILGIHRIRKWIQTTEFKPGLLPIRESTAYQINTIQTFIFIMVLICKCH